MIFIKPTKKRPLVINESMISCGKNSIPIEQIEVSTIEDGTKPTPKAIQTWKTLGVLAIILGGIVLIATFALYAYIWLVFGGWSELMRTTTEGLFSELLRLREIITTPSIIAVALGIVDLIIMRILSSIHQKAATSLGLKVTMKFGTVYFFSGKDYKDLTEMLNTILLRQDEIAKGRQPSNKSYTIFGDVVGGNKAGGDIVTGHKTTAVGKNKVKQGRVPTPIDDKTLEKAGLETRYCGKCGKAHPIDVKFCSECGTPLKEECKV